MSVFDLFKIGIGPSSSHTVGPMRAAGLFVDRLAEAGVLDQVTQVRAELFGSLGATGHGHGSVTAVILGLLGERPDEVDPELVAPRVEHVRSGQRIELRGQHTIPFNPDVDIVLHRNQRLDFHSNGMTFTAWTGSRELATHTYYSVGGGFVLGEDEVGQAAIVPDTTEVPHPFATGADLLSICDETGLSIAGVMLANERAFRPDAETRDGLLRIWQVMQDCVMRGTRTEGLLPGGLRVKRRAPQMLAMLQSDAGSDPLRAMDWVTLWALAVNEQNAAGGQVVTAPTNGAAGISPAVLHYYRDFVPGYHPDGVVKFLLTAAAIGIVIKENASISGAEVGCQGEVGSACAMAAAGMSAVLGGTPHQVENAAEIGLEHNLGLTCDPIGGLVQIPCIERNAVASVKAITASRLARRGDGMHHVSLDKAVTTMRLTGADMKDKYKETARGGLALNIVEC